MARGKALLVALRANPKVRDPQALAAHLGRVRKYRSMGISASKAASLAGKEGGSWEATGKYPTRGEKQLSASEETDAYRKRVLDNVKRGSRVRVSSNGDSAYGRVVAKTRANKIRFQPDTAYKGSSKEREIDPADVKQYSEPPSRTKAEAIIREAARRGNRRAAGKAPESFRESQKERGR